MESLRALLASIGLPTKFGIRELYGYPTAPPWSLAPPIEQPHLPQHLPVRAQIKRRKNQHLTLDLVRIAPTSVDEQVVDCAVQIAREIYAAFGINIGRIERTRTLSASTGYDVIEEHDIHDLVDDYGKAGMPIDVFFVQEIVGNAIGVTPRVNGKQAEGLAVESAETAFWAVGHALAHEIGHFFGLGHVDDPTNVMTPGTDSATMSGGDQLTPDQVAHLRKAIASYGDPGHP